MIQPQPVLHTERLLLRPFAEADAARVQQLAGDELVARMTGNVPHPYDDGMAEQWIATHRPGWQAETLVVFAVIEQLSGQLVGAISLTQRTPLEANLGYWIGRPYWGRGFCTEAARRLLAFGFAELELPMIFARHLPHNQASARVIEKLEFVYQCDVSVSHGGENRRLRHYTLYADACGVA